MIRVTRTIRGLSLGLGLLLPVLAGAVVAPQLPVAKPVSPVCGEEPTPATTPSEGSTSQCRLVDETGQTVGVCLIVVTPNGVASSCVATPPSLPVAITN